MYIAIGCAGAVPLVHRHVESFEGYGAVIAPPASCAGTVQCCHHAIAAERGDAALRNGVAWVAPMTYELSQFSPTCWEGRT